VPVIINREVLIRNFGVGLVALVTVAAASLLLRRRHLVAAGRRVSLIDTLYDAGL
jgi:hypothetical protein